MATNDIGRVTPIWRGFYSDAAQYELNDIVLDADRTVWWHKGHEITVGTAPAEGDVWGAVIDMGVFGASIREAIETAQAAVAAAQEAVAEVTADTERAETAADNAEISAQNAATSAADVGAYAQAAEAAKNAAQTAASQAAASASSAGASAASAGSSAQAAETAKTAAQTAANQAAGSAETASDAAAVVEQKKAEALAAIEDKGEEVLESIPEDYTELSGDVGELKTQLNVVDGKVSELATYPNLANPALFNEGYMGLDGTTYPSTTAYFYTAKIPVEEGQVIKANHWARFITAFSGNTAIPASGVNDQSGPDRTITYTVPSGIDGLVFSFRDEYAVNLMVYVYEGIEYEYIPYGKISYINPDILPNPLRIITNKENRPIYKETSGTSFAANTFISLPVYSCTRKNTRLIFRANISSLGNFEIGFTTKADASGTKYNRFVIRQNGLTAYLSYNYQQQAMNSEAITHNLNITTGSLQVIIEEHPNATCTITIENDGNTFKHTFEGYVKNNTLQPYCYSAFGSFSKYKFVWRCTDLDKKIWIFGDSYMAYSDERWAYYLEEYGYAKNALFNSFPGCWSSTAITALNSLINYGNPKYIVWAMGMNDGSDSESAPSTSWANNRDLFIAVCEENDIEPIFCTIPTVPPSGSHGLLSHEQKNAWIRSSGYRYIDFARAVNASPSGEWDSGTLSGDNTHPTINGARALYAEFILDFSEIMQGLDGIYPPIIPEKIGDNTEKKLVFNADSDSTVTWTNW